MNGIYRVIFNHATQTWTAVSELAKGRKKTKSEKMVAVASVVSLVLASSGVYAATQILDGKLTRPSTEGGSVIIAETVSGNQNVIIGSRLVDNVTNTQQSIVIGNDIAMTNGRGSIAIGGDDAYSAGGLGTVGGQNFAEVAAEAGGFNNAGYRQLKVTDAGAIGIGSFAVATGKGATAVGLGATASVEGATSFGTLAFSTGTGSSAFGLASRADGSNTLALGAGAKATQAGSIALGAGSVTTDGVAVTSSGQKYEIGGTTYDPLTNTDYDVNNVVSVGNETVKRQIQNVAPGQITETSTDAINGSQLYAITKGVQQIINNNYQTIQNNINNSGFNLKNHSGTVVTPINKADAVTFKNGTFTTSSVSANGDVAYNVVTQNINVANGVPTETGTAGLATAQTVATAIKNSGFNLQANGQNGSLIKAGDTVSINKGDNTDVVKTGNTITVHANKTEVTATASDIKLDPKVTGRTTSYNIALSDAVKQDIAKGVQALAAVEGRVFSFDGDNSTTTGEVSEGNITFAGGENINTVASEENGRPTVTINLNSDITVDNVTVGTVKISKDEGINAGDKTITGVATGGNIGTNAANIDDVKRLAAAADTTASTSGTNGIEVVKTTVNGKTTDYQVGLTKAIQEDIAKGVQALTAVEGRVFSFDGDSSTTTGEVSEGNITFAGGNNINTVASVEGGRPTVTINLDSDIAVDNVTVGAVKISKDEGISAGSKAITGVSSGGDTGTNAANISDVKRLAKAADTSASVSSDNAQYVSVRNNGTTNSITDYAVDLSAGAKASLAKADSAVQEIKTTVNGQAVKTLTKDDNTQDFENGKNIDITTKDGKIIVATKPNVEFTSVSTNTLDAKIGTITDLTSVKMTTGSITATTASVDNLVADNANVGILLTRDSATIGGLLTANGGLAVASNQRIDMGDNQVHNVKAGTADTDAVNVSQLKANTTTVAAGKNITSVNEVRDANGIRYTIDGKDTTVSNAQGSPVSVTKGTEKDGVTDYVVDLSAEAKTSLAKADTAVQDVKGQGGITANKGADNVVTVELDAPTKQSLTKADSAVQEIKTTVNGQAVKTLTKDNNTQDFENGKNIDITTKDGKIIVATKDSVTFTDVKTGTLSTTGDATIGGNMATTGTATIGGMLNANGGLSVANGQTVNMGNNRIQGVADGTADKDAVNLSQLNATKNAINTEIAKGLNFSADSGNTVNRKLGDTLAIVGGNGQGEYSTTNVRTVTTTDGVRIELADNPTFKNVKASDVQTATLTTTGTATIGGMLNANGGLTVANGQTVQMGNNRVQGVANAVNATDAVNLSQLNATKVSVVGGANITSVDSKVTDNGTIYTINAKDTSATVSSANEKALKVTPGAGNNGITDFALELGDDTKASLTKADTAVQDVKGQGGITANKGADNVVTVELDAPTKQSLTKADSAVQEIKTTVNGQAVKTLTKDNNTQDFENGKNIDITTKDGKIIVATKDSVTFTDVKTGTLSTTGDATIGGNMATTGTATIGGMLNANGGLSVANGQTVNMGNNRIQGVADGTADKDAVNLSQLNATKNAINTEIAKGLNFSADSGNTVNRKLGDTLAIVGGNGQGEYSTTNVRTVTTTDGVRIELADNPTFKNVKASDVQTATLTTTGTATIGGMLNANGGLTVANGQTVQMGNNRVQGVANAVNATDAVNLSQLNATKVSVVGGANITSVDSKVTDNGTIYTINAKDTSATVSSANEKALKVTPGAGNNGITDFALELGDDTKASLTKADTAVQDVKGQGGITANKGADNVVTVELDAPTKQSLTKADSAVQEIKTTVNGQAVKTLTKDNNTQDFENGKNIDITTKDGKIIVATKDSVTFTDVKTGTLSTTGDATIGGNMATTGTATIGGMLNANGGLSVANGQTVNMGNNRIQGVADGTADKDAVNLSQLNATKNAINTEIAKGLNFSADSGNTVNRKLGDTLAIVGGNGQGEYSTTNVRTVTTTDGVRIELADNPTFKNVKASDVQTATLTTTGTATIGGMLNANGGLTVANGQTVQMGNNRVQGVANAVNATDAVNLSQLNATKVSVVGGANITSVDSKVTDNGTIYTINAKDTSATVSSANEKALKVTPGAGNNGITDFALELGDDTKASLTKADTAVQDVKGQGGITANKGADNVVTVELDAPTKQSLTKADSAVQEIKTTVNGQAVKTLTKDNNTQDFENGKNIDITTKDGKIIVATKDSVTFTDVKTDTLTATTGTIGTLTSTTINNAGAINTQTLATTGTATIGGMLNANGGLTVANGQTVNMGNNRIQGVADGTADKDAVNLSQLNATKNAINTEIAKGLNFSADSGNTVNRKLGDTLAIVGGNGQGEYSTTNVRTVTTADGVRIELADNPTFKNVKASDVQTATLSTTGDATIGGNMTTTGTATIGGMLNANGGLTVANGQTVQMGNNRVQGVANAVNATDAVNLSQLNATKVSVVGGANITSVDSKVTDNGTIYTINAKDTSATVSSANEKALKVTPGAGNNGITDFALELGDDTKASLTKADTAVQDVKGQGGITANKGADNVVTVELDAPTKQSLTKADSAVQEIKTTVNGQAVKTLTKDNNTQDFENGKNIDITTKDGKIIVATKDSVTFTDVKTDTLTATTGTIGTLTSTTINNAGAINTQTLATTGTATIGGMLNANGGLTVANGQTVNMGNNRIQGVADGTADKDAVNLSQLNATKNAINTEIAKGLNFSADSGNTVNRKLGDTLAIVGGNGQGEYSTTNVRTVTTADGVRIELADNPTFKNVKASDVQTATLSTTGDATIGGNMTTTGTATIGGMLNANGGLTVANGQTVQMGNNRVQGVANAVNATDAVNLSQLNATKVSVVGGANITSVDSKVTDNGTIYTINAKDTSATVSSANEKALKVTPGAGNNGITDFALELGDDTKASLTKADTAVQDVKGQGGITANKGADNVVTVELDAPTKQSLTKADSAVQEIKTTVNGQAVKTLTKDNNTQDFENGKNIDITTKDGKIIVATKDSVTFTDVKTDTLTATTGTIGTLTSTTINNAGAINTQTLATTGTATIGGMLNANGGLTVANGQTVNMGNNRIQGVADGTADKDAVNLSQLNATKNAINTEIAKGLNFSADSGNVVNRQLGDTFAIVGGKGQGEYSTTNVRTVTTTDGVRIELADNPTFKNVKASDVQTATLSTTGIATIGGMLNANGGLTVANGQTVQMGDNRVQGVADGTADKDAVNVSQLRNNVTTLNNNIDAAKTELTAKGLDFSGNTGEMHRNLGTKLAITGAAKTAGAYSGANLKTVVTDKGVELQFAENPEFKAVTATDVTTTNLTATNGTIGTLTSTTINNAGAINTATLATTGDATIGGNLATKGTATFGGKVTANGGIDLANNKIENVADGTADKDAVNLSQLNATKNAINTEIAKGLNFSADSGNTVNRKLGDTLAIVGGNGQGEYSTTNVRTVTTADGVRIELADNPTFKNVKASDVQTATLTTTGDATIGGNMATTGTATISGMLNANGGLTVANGQTVQMGNNRVQGVADGTADKDAVNVSQLRNNVTTLNNNIDAAKTELTEKGLDFSGNTGEMHRNLGTKLAITGAATTAGDYSGANLKTVVTDKGVELQFAENPEFKAVTATDVTTTNLTATNGTIGTLTSTTINNAGAINTATLATTGDATIGGNLATTGTATFGGKVTANGGVDLANNKIENVADGTADKDAVNLSQLNATKNAINTEIAKGLNFSADSGNTVNRKLGDTLAIVGGKGQGEYSTTNVRTVTTADGVRIELADNPTFKNVKASDVQTATLTTTGTATIGGMLNANGGLTVAGSQTVNMGDNRVQGVADGTADKDAVNLSQLNATKNAINTEITKGLNFSADSGTVVNRQLGDTFAIVGGKGQGNYSTTNVRTVTTADGVRIELADDPTFKAVQAESVTAKKVNAESVESKKLSADEAEIVDLNVTNVTAKAVKTEQLSAKNATIDALTAQRIQTNTLTTTGNVNIGGNLFTTGSATIGGMLNANGGLTVANGQVVNMGGNRVQGVEDGIADSDAVNLGQLKAVSQNLTDKGFSVSADSGEVVSRKLGDTVAITAGNGTGEYSTENVRTVTTTNGVEIQLADNPTFNAVNATSVTAERMDTDALNAKNITADQISTNNVSAKTVETETLNAQRVDTKELSAGNVTAQAVKTEQLSAKTAEVETLTANSVNTDTLTASGMISANGGLTVAAGQTVNMGNNRIQGVANGVENSDAVNVAQLNNATTILNQAINAAGWTLKANGDSGEKIANNGEVNVKQGKNIQVNREGSTLTIQTVDNPNFTTVTANNVETKDLNATGNITLGGENGQVSVANGTKVDLGNNVINGVADGDISPNSKQAVNGGQVAKLISGEATLSTPDVALSNGKTITQIVAIDSDGKAYTLTTYNAQGRGEVLNNSVISAIHNMNEQGIKFFHTNDGTVQSEAQKTNSVDSQANGAYSTAVGYQASAEGTGALAIGQGAEVKGEGSVSIGAENSVNADNSGAVGRRNRINGIGSYVTGSNNRVDTQDTYVFGSGVTQTVANSVFLGNNSGYVEESKTTKGNQANEAQQIAGQTYYFAGGKAEEVVGVVSVGNVDERGVQQTRRIQNVAPGLISAESTDAVNGSQLHSVVSNLNQNLNAGYNALNRRIHTVDRHLRSGVAGAVATASLVQAYNPSDSLLAVGGGTYRGASALALGYSKVSDNGKVIFKLTGSVNNAGHYTGGASIGYRF